FAFAVLSVEIGIPILSVINGLTFAEHVSWNYVEMFHGPFLFWFFAVLCMILLFLMDRAFVSYLYNGAAESSLASRLFAMLARYRLAFYLIFAAFIVRPYLIDRPPDQHAFFPAEEPASVKLLKTNLAVEAGALFRGRMMVLGGTRAPPGDQWLVSFPAKRHGIFDTLELHYRQYLGNDHYIGLLGLGIPDATEYGHWTSPVTFTFLRAFFADPEDEAQKAFFPLRVFNPRIARLMGIRMIVTDA